MKRGLIIGIPAAVVLLVGGPWIYNNVISREPAPLALSTAAPDGDTSEGTTDGEWRVASDSVVGYRVGETLFGQNNTAVGRTSEIEGSIRVSGTTVTSGSFTVQVATIRSDRTQRDNQFNRRIMQTDTYPTSTFTFSEAIDVGSVPEVGEQREASVPGELTLHGVTKTVDVNVAGQLVDGRIEVNGSIPIVFADWNIADPSGGPARTEDNGLLEFRLYFERA
jgi:polyisoprenoid-binding protein YceI